MNDEIKPPEIKPHVFIGMKKASGEVKDISGTLKISSWGVMVRLKKVFEGVNLLTGSYGSGWALNWFLEVFPKDLHNLHYLTVTSGKVSDEVWKVFVEAEFYLTGLTSEDDVKAWVEKRIESYRTMPVLAGGYTYYPRTSSWDTIEKIGEISIS